MSFKERAANAPTKPLCVIGNILDGLPEDEATAFRNMLAADIEVWPHTGANSIQEALEDEGYERIGDRIIRAHRAGACRCTRVVA